MTSKSTRTWHSNWGDPAKLAIDFFSYQSTLPDGVRFNHNAGRRSLAAWLDSAHAPYHEGFELHGDLFKVWRVNYQPSVARSDFCEREQSLDPRVQGPTSIYSRIHCSYIYRKFSYNYIQSHYKDLPTHVATAALRRFQQMLGRGMHADIDVQGEISMPVNRNITVLTQHLFRKSRRNCNIMPVFPARLDLPSALMVRFLESQGQALLAQETVESFYSGTAYM